MDLITEFIRSGEKKRQTGGIGLEVEHFVLHKKTGLPMPYATIEELFKLLEPDYPQAVYEAGHCVALENEETLITLEPGCQLELSFLYTADLKRIQTAYQKAMKLIEEFVDEKGYEIVYAGGLPTVDVDSFPRIQKARYALMEAYFQNHGTRGKEMMKGTAAVHVSVDYADEKDYVKKMRMANLLHPVFAFLCFDSWYYAGKKNTDLLLRDSIWQGTDPDRCRIVDDLFADDFGYQSYANYVLNAPLILMHTKEDAYLSVQDKTCREVAKEYGWSDQAIAHYLLMVFPNIRTKNFIEIRSADSMPLNETMAYCAFLKGLFYRGETVEKYEGLAHSIDTIHATIASIRKDGWQADVYGYRCDVFCEQLLEDAKKGLDEEDLLLLAPLEKRILQRKHIGEL